MDQSSFSFNFQHVEIYQDQPLGSGAYGAVYKAKCDQLPCAAKILHPMFLTSPDPSVKETISRFHQECLFLASIKHPHIVQFLGTYTDPKSNQTALLMELMDESLTAFLDRHSAIGNVPFHIQVDICHDVVLALHYLHMNGIIHRDLSSNNVLLLGGCRAKITDLGVSKLKDAIQQRMTQCPGSPVYMPPEALRLQTTYSEKLDSFSFGILTIQLLTRRFPNPDPHEILIADASSPTGFISMPVKELDRRAQDIALIQDDNALKHIALSCIEDIASERPSSTDLCQQLESLKTGSEYNQSRDNVNINIGQNQVPVADELKLKEKEIERLKADIREYQITLEEQQLAESVQVKNTGSSFIATTSKDNVDELTLTNLEADETETLPLESVSLPTESVEEDSNKKLISDLNPDIVALLSKCDLGEIAGVIYNEPKIGCITVMSSTNETDKLYSIVSKVIQAYQKVANIPSQLEFVQIPTSFPPDEIQNVVSSYNSYYPQCSISYLKALHALQIVSINPTSLTQAKQQVINNFSFTVFLPGGRKLCLKKGDIVKENVSVIVTATNHRMNPSGGMCRAVNIASHYKIQKYCEEYVNRHGPLKECGTFVTPAGGDLKCHWVIHAVAPDGSRRNADTVQAMMTKLIKQCLTEADERKAISVALPAIGTGHYHVARKLAARAIMEAVMEYDYKNDETLREMNIVIIDDRTYNEFAEVFAEHVGELEETMKPNRTSSISFSPDRTYDKYVPGPLGSSCRTQ